MHIYIEGFWHTLRNDRPQNFVNISEISSSFRVLLRRSSLMFSNRYPNETNDASLMSNIGPKRRFESVRVIINFGTILVPPVFQCSYLKCSTYFRLYNVKTACFPSPSSSSKHLLQDNKLLLTRTTRLHTSNACLV